MAGKEKSSQSGPYIIILGNVDLNELSQDVSVEHS
jgi:hypothetical protein